MTEPIEPPEPLTDADLSRLVTSVAIHEGRNPYGLHIPTFERLTQHGLTAVIDLEASGVEYDVTPQGRALVERMLAAGRADG